jgi:PAS domain S-box-containing protein
MSPSSPPIDAPDHEARRLQALDQYDLLDAPPQEAFDRITRLATRLFDVPIAMVNVVDHDSQWCLATQGISLTRTSREVSFCTHTIQQSGVMVVEDARTDDRFADNPLVIGEPGIRFYAGAPLTAPNGYRLGTLCLIDTKPRSFSESDRASLRDLAGVVVDELNLRNFAVGLDASRQVHQETSEQVTRILESITDAFFAVDDEWTFTYVNAQAESTLKRSRNDLVGANLWTTFADAVGSSFHEQCCRALDTQETAEFTAYFPPLNSWFEVKAFPFPSGLSVYFDDVTGRVEAQENLRRERDLTEAIMNTSVAAILTVGAQGEVVYANERARSILGIDPEDVPDRALSTSAFQLYDVDGSPLADDDHPFARIKASGDPLSGERYMIHTADDEERILSINGAPLCADDGTVRRVVFSITDITDEIERQRELEQAKDDAEQASRLKSTFLANMSHDVRTPISSILSVTELLKMEAPESLQQRIALIERSSHRLLNTIDSVLDLAKLESGSVSVDPKPIDVNDEILGTAELFQPKAAEANVTLQTDVDADRLVARLDPTMVHRIADNLVSNALKFTDAGGTVTVRTRATEDHAVLEVEDTGVGIDDDFLPGLFEAFSRDTDTADHEGNGLGLAITKHLTELLDGTIEVESTKGKGTTFTVRLPRRLEADDECPQPQSVGASAA